MAARVSQVAALVLQDGAPEARVSQVAALALQSGSPDARVSQIVLLILQPNLDESPVDHPFRAQRFVAQLIAQ